MANAAKESGVKDRELSIEELARRHSVPGWALEGLRVRMGWGEGKEIEESKFLKALDGYLKGPMHGGDKK
jgi:hypothetical protein